MIKKKPIFGALPKLNMPQRTSIQKKSFERPYRGIANENAYIISNQTYIYHSFKEFCAIWWLVFHKTYYLLRWNFLLVTGH